MEQIENDSGSELASSQPLSDQEFEYLVDQELHRRNHIKARAILERPENLLRWREVLSQKYVFAQSRIVALKAEKLTVQQECLARGQKGYQDWVAYSAEADKKVAATIHFQAIVQTRLARIKALKEQRYTQAKAEQQRTKAENTAKTLEAQATSKAALKATSYEAGYQEGFRKGFRKGYALGWDDAQTKIEPDVQGIRRWIEEHLSKRGKAVEDA